MIAIISANQSDEGQKVTFQNPPNLRKFLRQPSYARRQIPKAWKTRAFIRRKLFMGDDMEKKGQPGSQSGQGQQSGQSGQQGQRQTGGQPGQYQPKKGGQGEAEEDDQNRDRQRRAS
jgi:hypothetical protein